MEDVWVPYWNPPQTLVSRWHLTKRKPKESPTETTMNKKPKESPTETTVYKNPKEYCVST